MGLKVLGTDSFALDCTYSCLELSAHVIVEQNSRISDFACNGKCWPNIAMGYGNRRLNYGFFEHFVFSVDNY